MAQRSNILKALGNAAAVACALALACLLASCSGQAPSISRETSDSLSASDIAEPKPASSSSSSSDGAKAEQSPITYPAGWLAVESNGVPAGVQLRVLQLPSMNVVAHRDGAPISPDEQAQAQAGWPLAGDGEALVECDGRIAAVPADLLLVNLPDVLPQAAYDIVYSYASTSRCAGRDIPGVTGERLPGYADGRQDNPYWSVSQFNAPCAYRTAVKAAGVCDALASRGLRLLVFDAYRPMTAQYYLSDQFENAFYNDAVMQESLGAWALEWYVASGSSGHNFGTDLDVGVCDMDGNPIPMPSDFDAFDESGHLTDSPMDAYSIDPSCYRDAVLSNSACMALHEAFAQAGFSELASEWWHFADDETEAIMRSTAGNGGLDFQA